MMDRNKIPPHPTFAHALVVWVKIGLLSFGGPAGQIALMHTLLVDKLKWISNRRFLHALNYCMLLPGPEAQQTAIYTGWLLHGIKGGIAAGFLFVVPGALLMLAISYIYVMYGAVPFMAAVFYGLKSAVMAIVAGAVIRIGTKVLKRPVLWFVSAVSFIAIFFLGIPFPVIVLSALAIGMIWGNRMSISTPVDHNNPTMENDRDDRYVISDNGTSRIPRPTAMRTALTAFLWTGIWLAPLLICLLILGFDHTLSLQGLFFSKAALVTFGGAYAVLPYVAQHAVEVREWLSPVDMMAGLGLAETTPGPLILVLQFVGFMGGWNHPMTFSPLVTAMLASFIASWAVFMPGCLFIFTGAPYIEQAHGNARWSNALTVVTAAVVGVILNLAVWFALNAISAGADRLDWIPLFAAIAFFYVQYRWKWGVLSIVASGALLGISLYLLGLIS
ncbi:MAG TPA: chromate efflux transporter [Kiritimatiellia bacterium]|nr:chromate efflux transporter [Kiritimatiellia bacterium]